MRKLLWFTVGFAAGCGLCASLFWQHSLVPALVYSLISGAICLALKSKNDFFRIPALLFSGLTLSLCWFALLRGFYLSPVQHLDGQTIRLRVTATDYSEKTDYGFSLEGIAVLEGKPYKIRVFQKDDQPFAPGEVLESVFRIRLTTP